jgi:ankyrin repeat protein
VKPPIPTRRLPARPDLEQLKRQAKELLEAFVSEKPGAIAEVNRFFSGAGREKFALHHSQLVLARSYGFDSWPKLKAFVDVVTISRLIESVRTGNVDDVRAILSVRPELVNREEPSSHGYMALHYAVLERMAEMVRTLMQFGADPRAGTAGIHALRAAASPLGIAQDRDYDEIVAIIREQEQQDKGARQIQEGAVAELRRAFDVRDDALIVQILSRRPELIGIRMPGSRWSLLHMATAFLLPQTAAWMLEHGADVNSQASDGWTPLDVAGSGGGLTHYPGVHRDPTDNSEAMFIIQLLRSQGAKLTARSAVILGDDACLRRMAEEEDLVTPRDERGWLLSLAIDCDRPGILTLLLDLGLDPDARARVEGEDEIAFTWGMPLYQCARYGKHAMAEMLLERGADPNGQVYASGTPLSEAYGQRDEQMIALLERYGGKSNASMAGMYRRADLARRLLDEFGELTLPDDGFSAGSVATQLLGAAARGGDPEILRMAMERVAIPSGDPRWNGLLQAPLEFWNHWIGPWCHFEWDRSTYLTCFKMILARCGPPNAPLNCGATILHQIVVMGDHVAVDERVSFATAALDAGARLDMRDDLLKSTPLGWACRWGRAELVQLFLERGADPVELNAGPWATPLAWAGKKGHLHIAQMLRRGGGSTGS